MKLHKGDHVKIMAGNDRGKDGKIIAAFPDTGLIAVDGLNMRKKHVRPRRQGQKGELVRVPAPFPASRAMLICGGCKKTVRLGYKTNMAGKKVRVCHACGTEN